MSETHDPRAVAEAVFRERLAPLLALADEHPDATELCVDGDEIRLDLGDAWLERRFGDFPGLTPGAVRAAGAAAAVFAGVEFGPRAPAVPAMSVKMPPDLRVTYVRPPAADRWHLSVRFLRSRGLRLDDYVGQGVMTAGQRDTIRGLLERRKALVVSGATGSGKTTLLRAMLSEVAELDRLVILEDTPELAIEGRNVVQLQTTLSLDLSRLLQLALRLRPDRIVVGEVRGPEALELLRASNTGHAGTLATVHSNGAEEALRRLHNLAVEAQPSYPFEGVVSAVDHVLQLEGRGRERRLADIWRVPKG